MTVLSVLRPSAAAAVSSLLKGRTTGLGGQALRFLQTGVAKNGGGHDRIMSITPSRYQWQKYKDSLHFYLCLTGFPLLAIIFYVNVFIGPATLTEIPCDYVPKFWEYERHPISRFLQRYYCMNPQECYERNLYYINEEDEIIRMRRLEKKILKLMSERGDYQNYYNTKWPLSKYLRAKIEDNDYAEASRGEE